jgi:dephospho-CoA kinase
LGKIVFSDEKERRFLNELIHPLVLEKKKEVINRLEKEGHYNIFISEAALTIEAGFADFFDKIIMTYCKKEVQIERLMEREGISRKQAMKIMKSQMQPQEKLKYADYIVDTSGSLQSSVEQTERVYRSLMIDHEMKDTVAKYKP